jgi:thioredoxin-like negative regulator of GroEL
MMVTQPHISGQVGREGKSLLRIQSCQPLCKLNVDTDQELTAHYGISSTPALLIFKDGQIAVRHVGVTPDATLQAELQRFSEQ